MDNNLTDITVLLDRTGSMENMVTEVIGGYNSFVKDQRTGQGKAVITLIQFDSMNQHEVVYEAVDVKKAKLLDKTTYVPRAATPLRDALGSAIVSTGERLESMPEAARPSKVVFVVFTDGLENCSKEYTQQQIKDMVDHQTNVYNWQFVFMGAKIDAFAQGADLSFAAMNTLQVGDGEVAMAASFAATSSNVKSYRSTGDTRTLSYSDDQRKEADNKTA